MVCEAVKEELDSAPESNCLKCVVVVVVVVVAVDRIILLDVDVIKGV
jgi:hypothetical protein